MMKNLISDIEMVQFVLRNKREDEQEYTLHLFEKCNLSCGFCWQDHKALDGVQTVRSKVEKLSEMFSREQRDKIVLNIMGGEIFDDSIFNDSLYSDYVFLCTYLQEYCKSINKVITFSFVSNLVTNQVQKVRDLFEELTSLGLNVKLTTSYDSKGRFNPKQFEVYKSNMLELKDLNPGVSMLLTKPVIKDILNRRDEYFIYLYEQGYEIYFDYYTPTVSDKGTDSNQIHLSVGPSDLDLLRVFYFLIDHYPKVQPINGWISNQVNKLSCRSSKLLLPDNTECMCGNLQQDKKEQLLQFYKSTVMSNDNKDIETTFTVERNCITCEYFQRCQMGCFMQHDFKQRSQLTECVFKLTFDKIVKNQVVDIDNLRTHFG